MSLCVAEQRVLEDINCSTRIIYDEYWSFQSFRSNLHDPRDLLAGAGSPHSDLSIFHCALVGIIRFRTKLHRCEDGAWLCRPRLPCTTSWDIAYYLKVILRTSRHATADADHRAGYVNTDNCVTRTPPPSFLPPSPPQSHTTCAGRDAIRHI